MTVVNNEPDNICRGIAVLGYLTLIGWIIALLYYGQHKSPLLRYHLRQSLGIYISAVIAALIPLIGWFVCILLLFAWLIGMYSALMKIKYSLPLVGDFYQQHLDFIA